MDRTITVLGGFSKRHSILGKAGAPIARPSMQEFFTNPIIHADALCDFLNISANAFAEVCHLVNECNFHG
ncbi:hypothetical protein D9M72_609210 [compost metagenome]